MEISSLLIRENRKNWPEHTTLCPEHVQNNPSQSMTLTVSSVIKVQ